MSESIHWTALPSLISLAGLWWFLFWPYRDLRVDKFRQEMFALRDELFDYAGSSAQLSFDDTSYGILRSAINGFIRHGHRFTLWQTLATLVFFRDGVHNPRDGDFRGAWNQAVMGCSPEARAKLEELRMRMNVVVLKHLVLASPVLMATVVVPVVFWVLLKFFLRSLLAGLREPLNDLDSAALAFGQ